VLRDFGYFLAALWREWKVFLTGGSIVAAYSFWNLAGWKPLPQNANWLILGATFILASFFAWRREWIESGRDILVVRPTELVKLFASGTNVHGETLVKPYIGKRLRATGTVYDVQRNAVGVMSYVFLKSDEAMLALWVPRRAIGPFIPLPKGATITVVGRIHSVYDGGIRMTNCAVVVPKMTLRSQKLRNPPHPICNPAAIAGVTRSDLWTRAVLPHAVQSCSPFPFTPSRKLHPSFPQ
jgi:hypothetical protein